MIEIQPDHFVQGKYHRVADFDVTFPIFQRACPEFVEMGQYLTLDGLIICCQSAIMGHSGTEHFGTVRRSEEAP